MLAQSQQKTGYSDAPYMGMNQMGPPNQSSYINLANETSNQSMTSQDLQGHLRMANGYPSYQPPVEQQWRGSAVPEQ